MENRLARSFKWRPEARVDGRLSCEGQALVEFALVMPMLLLVMLGIARIALTFNNYITVTDAVRAGARQLAMSRGQTTNPCQVAASRVYSSAPNLVQASLSITQVINGVTYGTTCSGVTMAAGSDVKVTLTYPCNLNVMGLNFAPGCTLKSETTERVE